MVSYSQELSAATVGVLILSLIKVRRYFHVELVLAIKRPLISTGVV